MIIRGLNSSPVRLKLCQLVYLPLFLVYLKGEVFLRHIAKADHDDGRQYLGDRGIDMELFYEQLDEDDI